MTRLSFLDTTLRDGHHSLWAQGMRTGMMLPVASQLDEVGFKAIEVIGSGHFKKCIRELKENPWERIRLVAAKIKKTPLAFMMLPSVTTFDVTPLPVLKVYIERLAAHGIRRIQLMEPANDMNSRVAALIEFMKAVGVEPVIGLVYSISPKHTDEYYQRKAQEAALLKPSVIYIKDPAGLLTPERTRTIVPAVITGAGGLPVEFHSHCTTGLAPICYVEAIKVGIRVVHTAIPPLANGSSQPSIFNVAKNAAILGFEPDIDLALLPTVVDHFTAIARSEGLPTGVPVEYDVSQYLHHVPGGVISHLQHQLTQLGQVHRLSEVLNEIGEVRRELGYPIMVTPFSQFVASQAALNVILGRRYNQVTDEIIQYATGIWGEEAASGVEPNLRDQILQMPRAKEIVARPNQEPTIGQVRARLGGPDLSDEDLILRYIAPASEVEAMYAAGPPRTYAKPNPAKTPFLRLVSALSQRKDLSEVQIGYGESSVAFRSQRI